MKKWGISFAVLLSVVMLALQFYISKHELAVKQSAPGKVGESVGVPLPAEAAALAPTQNISFLEAAKNKIFRTEDVTVTAGSVIVMYAHTGDPVGGQATQMSLKFRGLTCEVVLLGSLDEIKSLGVMDKLKDAGIATTSGDDAAIGLPFFKVDGKFRTREQLFKSIAHLPLVATRESPDPYIVVYGLENCPYSQKGINALDDTDMSYIFRDVNDPNHRPRYKALMEVNNINYHEWPLMDVSGHILSNPSIEQIKEHYR